MPEPHPNHLTVSDPPQEEEAAHTRSDETTVAPQIRSDTPKLSVQQLVDRLVQSGLMSATEVKALQDSLAAENRLDIDTLAADLLRHKKLTRFQVDALLQDTPLKLGEYILQEKIGEGGMGQVYKALHRRMDRTVALKLLPKQTVASADAVERFQREVKAAAKLSHPNIVTAYDAGEQDNTPFFVMEYIPGTDLFRHVKEKGPLAVVQAVDYILQAAKGLEYAHGKGVIHRDIKPANLLLTTEGTVKILDLGLARFQTACPVAEDSHLTKMGIVMGTPDYMPPEQSLDSSTTDHRADIYSLGCSLYFLLTGKPMYEGTTAMKKIIAHREKPVPSLRQGCPDASEKLDAVFQRMVAKKLEDRYQSMSQVIADLQTSETRPAQASAPEPPPARRRLLGPASVLVVCVLAGAVAFLISRPPPPPPPPPVGAIALEIDQVDVEVSVDGQEITIDNPNGKEPPTIATIELVEGKYELKVCKERFKTYTQEFSVKSGNKEWVSVHLVPGDIYPPRDPTLEEVLKRPSEFDGKILTFTVRLLGEMTKTNPVGLNVRSSLGKLVTTEELSFHTFVNLATKLKKETEPTKEYLVNLTCKIRQTPNRRPNRRYWVAFVLQVDFVGEDRTTLKSVDNSPAPATVTATLRLDITQPGAEILIDNKRIAPTDAKDGTTAEIQVSDGEHEIEVRKQGFKTHTAPFTIAAGATQTIKVQLEPALEVTTLKDLFSTPEKFEGKSFIIDRVNMSGEIKKQSAGPGYHIKFDPGDGNYTFMHNKQWNGFLITAAMGKQMMSEIPVVTIPSKYTAKLTCKLEKGSGGRAKAY